MIRRAVTVSGGAVSNPKNLLVPIGALLSDIFDATGGFRETPVKILTGGPMMGLALAGTELPILKQNNAILAFGKEAQPGKRERDCIRCGRCAWVCPLQLTPALVQKAGDAARLRRLGADLCMECGSCAFSCPAGLPLLQYMRNAKSILKEANEEGGTGLV